MGKVLVYTVNLPSLQIPHDVAERVLTVQCSDAEPVTFTVPAGQADVQGIKAKEGDTVKLCLTDVDAAGNRSECRDVLFTAVDTIPPAQPGEFSVVCTGEEFEPEVEPEPTPVEPEETTE